MTNRQARALAELERQVKSLKGKQRRELEDHIRHIGPEGVVREFGRKASAVKDLFGSMARRAAQAEKDAKETAAPVMSGFTPAEKVSLALRSVAQRAAQRSCEDGAHDFGDAHYCIRCDKQMLQIWDKDKRREARRGVKPVYRRQHCRAGVGA